MILLLIIRRYQLIMLYMVILYALLTVFPSLYNDVSLEMGRNFS